MREIAIPTATNEFFPHEIAILSLSIAVEKRSITVEDATSIESPFITIPRAGIQLIADKIAIDVKLKAA
ncbi:MAG TPA: hypothetical protein VKB86_02005 [Pyrinomonadaceae bacterium]|nr:hypothetical protein [Pyrinomonadaceae bacterium]